MLRIVRARGADEGILKISGNVGEDREIPLRFLRNPLSFAISDASPDEIGQSPERRKILNVLREYGAPLKTGEIAKAIEKSSADVSMLLNKMAKQGLVVQAGYGLWTLPEKFKRITTIESIESVESSLQLSTAQEDTLQTNFKRSTGSIESSEAKPSTLNTLNTSNTLNTTIGGL